MTTHDARLIDLTLPAPLAQDGRPTCALEERHHVAGDLPFTGMVYHFRHDSMAGTYIDLPGHIKETDDGQDIAGYPLEKLYRVEAVVAHLDRAGGSGRIGREELAAACPPFDPLASGFAELRRDESRSGLAGPAEALILNALGSRRFDEIEERSVYLGKDAVRWIIDSGFHLLVSDVYESDTDPQQVFYDLFADAVSTVCHPVNLHLIDRPRVRLTVLAARFPAVTQLPCRVVVEVP